MDRVREKKRKNLPPIISGERSNIIQPIAITQLDAQIDNNTNFIIQDNHE